MESFGLEDIEGKWVEEKSNEELTSLSEDFYEEAASYVSELKRELRKSRDLRRDLLRVEIDRILEMIQEIYLLRALKMMDSLIEEKEGDLIEKEKEAFEGIRGRLEDLQEDFVDSVVEGEPKLTHSSEHSNLYVSFLKDIPKPITGADMNYYGPFEEGEVANIPDKTAELLIDQGLAEKISTESA